MAKTAVKRARTPAEESSSVFRPGQVWSYKTRRGDEDSCFTVLRTDRLPEGGAVIHVRVDGVRLAGKRTSIEHIAIREESLTRSAVQNIEQNAGVPDFASESAAWTREKGVFSVTLSEVVGLFARVLR